MLCRIYGFHAINNTTFIVMGNVFSTHLQIDQLYDLKVRPKPTPLFLFPSFGLTHLWGRAVRLGGPGREG